MRCVFVLIALCFNALATTHAHLKQSTEGHPDSLPCDECPALAFTNAALLIIDVQHCFLPGGSLAVQGGDQVIPVINKIREDFDDRFSVVVLSQDWHCLDHISFASQHPGHLPFSSVNLTYNSDDALCYGDNVPTDFPYAVKCDDDKKGDVVVKQTLWPDHCVKSVISGPISSELSPMLKRNGSDFIVRKGHRCAVDSYSAFFDTIGLRENELDSILKQHEVDLVVVTGLALDYCVYYTSLDAYKLGYKVVTVTDASRGVAPETTAAALKDMNATGIHLVESADLKEILEKQAP